jgi:hypothetical protein
LHGLAEISKASLTLGRVLREGMHNGRPDGFGKVMASADRNDLEKMAILEKLRSQAMAAMGNMPKLMAAEKR